MIIKRKVAGESVTINALPPLFAKPLWDRWIAHVKANEGGIIGLDVETTAIDDVLGPFEPGARMRLIQFGSHRYAWALDPHNEFWRPLIIKLLSDPEIRFVSHTNYDPLWVRREFKINLGYEDRIIDAIIMAALLFPGVTERKGLKELADKYIDTQLSEAEQALLARFKELAPTGQRAGIKAPKKWGFTNIALDDPVFAAYSGLDAIYVRRLLDILTRLLKERRSPKLARLSRREQRIARLATDMRVRGLRVDKEWAHELLSTIEAEYAAADERLEALWGFPRYSPRRGDWLIEHGAEFSEVTPTGAPKLTMPSAASPGTLPDLVERYSDDIELGPVFNDMLILGSHKNMLGNVRIIIEQSLNDGLAHPEIKTMAAHTGRMSIIKPALQTLKKRDPRLRGCFIAREGKVLVGADYASQEIRIAAAYSRDPALLRIVRGDLNQHLETAKMIFGVADKTSIMDPLTGKTYYDAAKTLDFAQQYGAGPARIGDQLGYRSKIDANGKRRAHPKAVELWLAWREAYAGLVEWNAQIGECKMIINPWGRMIPADPRRGYASGNYAVQSTGRDILGDAMIKLDEAGWGEALWLPVHDELVLEVDKDEADEAAAALTECMSTRLKDIEIPAVGEIIGTRWGVAE